MTSKQLSKFGKPAGMPSCQTAALEHGCKMLAGDFDTTDNRKRIGDAIINAARARKCSLIQLIEVAGHEAAAIVGPSRPSLVDTILSKFRPAS